jgi:hypothetical protein
MPRGETTKTFHHELCQSSSLDERRAFYILPIFPMAECASFPTACTPFAQAPSHSLRKNVTRLTSRLDLNFLETDLRQSGCCTGKADHRPDITVYDFDSQHRRKIGAGIFLFRDNLDGAYGWVVDSRSEVDLYFALRRGFNVREGFDQGFGAHFPENIKSF